MYPEPDPNPDLYMEAKKGALKTYDENWFDAVRAGLFDWTGDIIDSMKKNLGMDNITDEILKLKLKDLSEYYENQSKRNTLRGLLKDEIMRNKDNRIMILSHSMGTIIAYDVLRDIGKEHPRLIVDYFITLGSPLGLPHVKFKMAQENPLVRTPSVVKKWTNFADRRDPVAIDVHLAGDYKPNAAGVKVKDDLVCNPTFIKVPCPWPLRLYWDLNTTTRSISIHEKLSDSLGRILDRLYQAYGENRIKDLGLDRYGGSYNYKKKRPG